MRATLRFLIALLGCLHLCGGHYGVLQGIAWTQMLISYSAEVGWQEGARRTFDGEHPCDLCVAISDAKKHDTAPSSPQRRGHEGSIELKPCPLSAPLVLTEPSALDLPSTSLPASDLLRSRLTSGPEPPPPRVC